MAGTHPDFSSSDKRVVSSSPASSRIAVRPLGVAKTNVSRSATPMSLTGTSIFISHSGPSSLDRRAKASDAQIRMTPSPVTVITTARPAPSTAVPTVSAGTVRPRRAPPGKPRGSNARTIPSAVATSVMSLPLPSDSTRTACARPAAGWARNVHGGTMRKWLRRRPRRRSHTFTRLSAPPVSAIDCGASAQVTEADQPRWPVST